jgi:phenylacetate-CoA ligase
VSASVPASAVPGAQWPALPGRSGAAVLALQFQLTRTERLPPAALVAGQLEQLRAVLGHAVHAFPAQRARLERAGYAANGWPADPDEFTSLAPLVRADVAAGWGDPAAPSGHGRIVHHTTAGTSGSPLVIPGTEVEAFFRAGLELRDHLWHRRDMAAPAAVIDACVRSGAGGFWGRAAQAAYRTGPSAHLDAATPLAGQVAWLLEVQPAYLRTTPSNLRALALECLASRTSLPGLREVCASGGPVGPELAGLCRQAWDVPVHATYAAAEFGILALQCPEHGAWHVQSENVLLEWLNDAGEHCDPAEPGRVVVSSLHNLALPLVRYDTGDYAQAGPPCACGRSLPVIARIVGRRRNLVLLPDGRRVAPAHDLAQPLLAPPVRDFRIVQTSRDDLQMQVVTPTALDAARIRSMARTVQQGLGHGFRVEISCVERLDPVLAAGHDDFQCLLPG